MPAPQIIIDKVELFERNIEEYKRASNETQVRRAFIDPLFKALGWDVENESGAAFQYQDVIHEDQVKVGGSTKAPDYSFRIGGNRKFFVEAKKPSVYVKDDPAPAFQVRSYGWSAKLNLSIVTDFEEFAIYECNTKPKKNDRPSVSRVQYFTYKDYIAKWDELASVFSKDAVYKGSFDRYASGSKGKRGTTTVDKAFLEEIEHWRELIAKNFAKNNKITEEELKFATQRTLDRIIFLRICEARGIEEDGRLRDAVESPKAYKNLFTLFNQADNRYNSGLFYFRKGDKVHKSLAELDTITPRLKLDDKVLKEIVSNLYYPNSPYQFDVIPADILGHVYEQFLGKVIRMTPGGMVKIEEKPEVRKAGGVYYTPTYIVEYIVKHTVGQALEANTKKLPVLKILDPACGSGSFLLGAYDYLLNWYLSEYGKRAEELLKQKNSPIVELNSGSYALTTPERKRILLEHIFGVDIDEQAVEVAKLNLMLKCLEGEGSQNLKLSVERILPDLSENVKCGNSLVGGDYLDHGSTSLFGGRGTTDHSAHTRIKPFDWKGEFAEIVNDRRGGFDVVIGNPPYRMLQPHDTESDMLDYLKSRFYATDFKIDLYHLFIQQGGVVLRAGGYLGYIVPLTLLLNTYVEKLRKWILDSFHIQKLAVNKELVFDGADVHTNVVILKKSKPSGQIDRQALTTETTVELDKAFEDKDSSYRRIPQIRLSALPGHVWNLLITEENIPILNRTESNSERLADVAVINRGLITGDRDKYFSTKKLNDKYVPIFRGKDVDRYATRPIEEFVRFERTKSAGGCWDSDVHLASHKIVVRQIGTRPTASYIDQPIAVTGNVFTVMSNGKYDERYLLGIINSNLIRYYWQIMFSDLKSSFPQVSIAQLNQIPIRALNLSDPASRSQHDTIVRRVEEILELHASLATITTPQPRTELERRISHLDSDIDRLVYELYGLHADEIGIIEGLD